jgi:hypothetical protein
MPPDGGCYCFRELKWDKYNSDELFVKQSYLKIGKVKIKANIFRWNRFVFLNTRQNLKSQYPNCKQYQNYKFQ